jgi:nucleoporin GLE1
MVRSRLLEEQSDARLVDIQRLIEKNKRQMDDVQSQLADLRFGRLEDEKQLRDGWQERDRKLRDQIEGVIKFEEDKVRKRVVEERRVKEEAERRQKEEAERRKKEEEEKQRAEEKRREDEERLKKELLDAMRRQEEREAAEKEAREQEKQVQEQREKLSMTDGDQDWREARETLKVNDIRLCFGMLH